MTLTIKAGRDLSNLWVDVLVVAAPGQQIASVQTVLDGAELATDMLGSQDSYQRVWRQVGQSEVSATHQIVLTAVDVAGKIESASNTFQDFGSGPLP